jgi:hypothetical protein
MLCNILLGLGRRSAQPAVRGFEAHLTNFCRSYLGLASRGLHSPGRSSAAPPLVSLPRICTTHRPSSTVLTATVLEPSKRHASQLAAPLVAHRYSLQHDGSVCDPRHDLEAATQAL